MSISDYNKRDKYLLVILWSAGSAVIYYFKHTYYFVMFIEVGDRLVSFVMGTFSACSCASLWVLWNWVVVKKW